MEAIIKVEMDRPIDVKKHCILPQGYEVETKDGKVYMFDFLTSYGFCDRENPAVIRFELYFPDYESFPDTHTLRKEIQNIVRIRDCCLDTEDIEIQPKKLLEFQIIDSVPEGGKRPLSTEFVKVETKLDDKEWGECRYIFTGKLLNTCSFE